MMQHETAEDWVLATGKTQTVEQFLDLAFESLDLNWKDYIDNLKGTIGLTSDHLLGDSSKAQKSLIGKLRQILNNLLN